MIVSIKKNFLFINTVKTASSSISQNLRPHADVIFDKTQFGKHMHLSKAQEIFKLFGRRKLFNEISKISVIREPFDWLGSIYRSHKKMAFRNAPSYTGDISFDEFFDQWFEKNNWQLTPQSDYFKNKKGEVSVDYLLKFEALEAEYELFCEKFELPNSNIPHVNKSPVSPEIQISPSIAKIIEDVYSKDFEIYESSKFRCFV